MGNSYRIRTTPGKDQNIVIDINQDFEQLEILSLKIRQDDVYNRDCSDYGVIAGRIIANNGYGIPNAKVSVFIPVDDEDLLNPAISAIYPYKSLSDVNEDGYKYNLLPYLPSYPNHTPTGTFPSRLDNLVNETAIQIYNKYFKFTVETNESGDYMIFGVPVGSQTLVMNLDLSDIGQFSLDPQDLVRMGMASEDEFNGNRFNASPNFETLPQIVVINKTIEVVPFWGEKDVCRIGISRADFDITAESNITIKPTAVFMGSMFSTTDETSLKQNCKVKQSTGNLCKMITGPGEILAITQTIFNDSNGLPILELAKLPNGGKLIDGDGTWLFDLPMNYDYVTTNEFGEQIISNDPTIGVPTKGKYRFKIKWNQPKTLSDDVKRAYWLVPNIKENGWITPTTDPLNGGLGYTEAVQSYAFDLDWSGYTSPPYNLSNSELVSYINCEDRFYEFEYNKVYTVSSFIDNLKRVRNRDRFLAIKRIDDDTCDTTTNKFPVNDGVFHTSIFWLVLNILLNVLGFIGLFLIILYDVVAFIINALYCLVTAIVCLILKFVCLFGLLCKADEIPFCNPRPPLRGFKLPMITYPDCEVCSCDGEYDPQGTITTATLPPTPITNQGFILPFNLSNTYAKLEDTTFYNSFVSGSSCIPFSDREILKQLIGGSNSLTVSGGTNGNISGYTTNDLPFGERINIFNSKGSFYNGTNQIKVTINPVINDISTKFHLDNTVTFVGTAASNLNPGDMFTTINPESSLDPNISNGPKNSYGTNNTTGTYNLPTSLDIKYSTPTNVLQTVTYNIPSNTITALTTDSLYSYASDIEYFQVITAMTVSDYLSMCSTTPFAGSFADILNSNLTFSDSGGTCSVTVKPINAIDQNSNYVVICQRGVDPNSPKVNVNFQLGKIFGYTSESSKTVNNNYRLNIPIKPSNNIDSLFHHDSVGDNNTTSNDLYLFYKSYSFTPDSSYISFNTILHKYYSSLDKDLIQSSLFTIYGNPLTPSQFQSFTPYNVISINSNSYYSGSISSSKYDSLDYLQGTSFIWKNGSNNFYYSPKYNTINLTMSNKDRIVMRSDRLPTSDSEFVNGNNSYFLQQNPNFSVYVLNINGTTDYYNIKQTVETYNDFNFEPNDGFEQNVFNTFSCDNMVSLNCYQQSGLEFSVKPNCNDTDRVTGGCYAFCPKCNECKTVFGILTNIGDDVRAWSEYIVRFKFFFALCQGVLSQVFNNNWINGTLFTFSFKVDTYFNNQNQVSGRKFCNNAVMLHPTTNTFYYRASPWDGTKFIGQNTPYPAGGQEGSNTVNIKYPTTILNMGPKNNFIEYVNLTGGYQGYQMDLYSTTSYQDTSEIVNLFVLMRLINATFLNALLNPTNPNTIQSLFSRAGKKVDADFAQTSAINSQFGIISVDGTSYSTVGPNQPIIASNAGASNIMLGVYFSTTTESIQARDYITPGRIIRWNPSVPGSFAYDYLPIKSQLTPHYRWTIQSGGSTIFGTQKNNWATDSNKIVGVKYQEMDRMSSDYPKYNFGTIGSGNNYNARGYLYADSSADFFSPLYYTSPLMLSTNPGLGGAPWYFYFGLIQGNSSMDRFYNKYIGENTLNG